ncbi:pilus assembly protein [Dyella acidiphila]|uniref:PilY1 beta-propeller domain-containing protein n=1 Tax=Dyella acidiphila TaxID=2775866 RepID=A0ABR9GEQ1_9GAMM|nr:PilC/PilY family type IV pilus protein [Dyella acidiphila]MBE1162529.1 hypothetical protein [Dyella acidiphila]
MSKRMTGMLAWSILATAFAGNLLAAQGLLAGTVELSPLPLDNSRATPSLAVLGLSGSVASAGLLAFEGGYDPADWSGLLQAVSLHSDGSRKQVVWNAGVMLSDALATPPDRRVLLTAHMDAAGAVTGMAFRPAAAFDSGEISGLMAPAASDAAADTLGARVEYLRGVRAAEGKTMRVRSSLLGPIVHAQALHVAYPAAHYRERWPNKIHGMPVRAPEAAPGAETYASFVERHAKRTPVLYVAANDGMLHAFNTPFPRCGEDGGCQLPSDAGRELWAYVPRAAYAHLGAFTRGDEFQFHPTVDATPVMRDVFFSQRGAHEWHSLLVGGLGLGGRGVYALDITDPGAASEAFPARTVLWEFDADAASGIAASGDGYNPADLGYVYGQPAIARLGNGSWAVLVATGYFPDCSRADVFAACNEDAAAAPVRESALFVLDAQTGAVIRELKTPADSPASYGLATPVLGDYNGDQIDDIAFAGDLAGNLWRFDLASTHPAEWTVSLAYRPATPDAQPITVMPRLFPDPAHNRYIVVFGTGKYLGNGDRTSAIPLQSVYGIRDRIDPQGHPITATRSTLQAQRLSEVSAADSGAMLRDLTAHPLAPAADGWYFDLTSPGERVVATPTALFDSNSVLISTLIPASKPGEAPRSAVLAVDAATGASANLFSFGSAHHAGAMLDRTSGSGTLPIATKIGGGKLILPGSKLMSAHGALAAPLTFDSVLWRRRSWFAVMPVE